MKHVQKTFSTWYNRTREAERKGTVWGQRYKNTVLEDGASVHRCGVYVEANPLRAGMVDTNRPWPAFPAALIRPEKAPFHPLNAKIDCLTPLHRPEGPLPTGFPFLNPRYSVPRPPRPDIICLVQKAPRSRVTVHLPLWGLKAGHQGHPSTGPIANVGTFRCGYFGMRKRTRTEMRPS